MLTKRIIPCLDVKNGQVVKGIKFKDHEVVGSIVELAKKYNDEGADELVFYDIGASTYDGIVSKDWVKIIAEMINIPFCVAGGIKSISDARQILNNGADINSIKEILGHKSLASTQIYTKIKIPTIVNDYMKNHPRQKK